MVNLTEEDNCSSKRLKSKLKIDPSGGSDKVVQRRRHNSNESAGDAILGGRINRNKVMTK
jgi:hypothetical protein